MEKLIPTRKSKGGGTEHDGYEEFVGQLVPTLEEIMKQQNVSLNKARKIRAQIKENFREDFSLPSQKVYADAFSSWSMD
jgi:hypothetical protein